jgi:uncharacterized delta-60 repeat protein
MKTCVLLTVLLFPCGLLLAEETVVPQSAFSRAQGVGGTVAAMVQQADGRIIIGGTFNAVNGVPRANVARLNADGTLDEDFAPTPIAGVSGPVHALALRPDGAILVGGNFNQAGGVTTTGLAVYLPDGTVDKTFASNLEPGVSGTVLAIALQQDGKIVIGGTFATVAGKPRTGVARLNADGTVDAPVPTNGQLTGAVKALIPFSQGALAGGTFQVTNQEAHSLFVVE